MKRQICLRVYDHLWMSLRAFVSLSVNVCTRMHTGVCLLSKTGYRPACQNQWMSHSVTPDEFIMPTNISFHQFTFCILWIHMVCLQCINILSYSIAVYHTAPPLIPKHWIHSIKKKKKAESRTEPRCRVLTHTRCMGDVDWQQLCPASDLPPACRLDKGNLDHSLYQLLMRRDAEL